MKPIPITLVAGLTLFSVLAASTSALARPPVLRNNSVTTPKIRNGAVTGTKLANRAVTSAKMAPGAVSRGAIANGAVSFAQIDPQVALWYSSNGSAIFDGKIGIGTNAPVSELHVKGNTVLESPADGDSFSLSFYDGLNLRCDIGIAGGSGQYSGFAQAGDTVIRAVAGESLHLQSGSGGAAISINANNWIGINKANPICPLDVANSFGVVFFLEAYLAGAGVGDYTSPGQEGSHNISINSETAVKAGQFLVNSDSRIKTNQHASDSEADLATLLGIQVTDYNYIDTLQGTRAQKKVIAQQVEQIYPLAVGKTTGVVPDIYEAAPIEGGWVALKTDLKVGERVKLVGANGGGVHEVLEVGEGRFRTAFEPGGDKVFVYGREVDDFRSVDYEAISMLNVSATQELARQLTDQKAENEKLKQRLGDLEEELTRTRRSLTEHREVAKRLEDIERAVFRKVN